MERIKFERVVLNNRWKRKRFNRSDSWVFIGIGRRYFSPSEYEIYFNFIGLELRFWFVKIWSE